MHHFAERDVIDIAVNEARSRRSSQRFAIKMLNRFVVTSPTLAQIEIGREAADMRHQLFDRNRVTAFAFHFGNELHNRIGEANSALLDKDHDAGGRRDDFGKTRKIENRIERHRFALGLDCARAVGFAPDNFSMARDQHYRTRQFFLLDRRSDDRVHPPEALRGNSLGCGKRDRKLSEDSLRN